MAVDSSTAAGQTSWYSQTSGVETVEDRTKLMKDDFLKLLVTQLQNQDPLNPADNQEFAAQLAQFSSLEQLTEMNKSLGATLESNRQIGMFVNNSVASSFIGRDVRAVGNVITLDGESDVTISYHQETVSSETRANIYDANGTLVRSMVIGPRPAGYTELPWDGKDSEGNMRSAGLYYFEVTAIDYEGQSVETVPFTGGRVTGVRYVDNRAILLLGDKQVALENVFDVLDAEKKE